VTILSGGDEGQRQAYLAALGLPLWTARHDLPGAAPSLPLVLVPFVIDLPDAVVLVETAFDQGPVAAASLVEAPPVVPAAPTTPADRPVPVVRPVSATSPVPSAAEASLQAAPRFALRVQPLAPGWLGIIALGDVPDLSAQEYRLLSSISQALGAAPDFSGSASLLRWPLNNNPRLDHGPGAAVEWLTHALKVPDGWRCLLLGEAVAVHVRASLPSATMMVAGPALTTLLTTPQTKRSLWLSLHV